MSRRGSAAALAALALAAVPAAAQPALLAGAGAAVGNHLPSRAGLELEPGPSFALGAEVPVRPCLALYAGYARGAFGCSEGLCAGREVTFTTAGFGAGLRLQPAGPLWVRLGAVRYGTRVEGGAVESSVPAAFGAEAGAGAAVRLGRRVELLPGAFLRTQAGAERSTVAGVEIGIRVRPGRP